MTINFVKGSDKQRAWAQDIIDTAYAQLDCMDRNVDNVVGMTYTHEQVGEVRKMLDSVCALPVMQDAVHVIGKRDMLHPSRIERTVRATQRDGVTWDADALKWTKR